MNFPPLQIFSIIQDFTSVFCTPQPAGVQQASCIPSDSTSSAFCSRLCFSGSGEPWELFVEFQTTLHLTNPLSFSVYQLN